LQRGLDSKHAVGADAAMAVAEQCDAGGIQRELSIPIVEHDEVVAGTIHFGEG
jgi:hypothetical protein